MNLLPQYLTLERIYMDGDSIRRILNVPVNAIVIGMIAQYRSDKYFDLLLDAYYQLGRQLKVETHLVILGNKKNNDSSLDIFENLKEKVKLYKLETQVSILSNIEVHDVLNIIDIGVLMSQIEGMPNTVMEYMSYGIPVVATNHPGCEQLLTGSDFLIPNDIKVLKRKLIELINSKELRDEEGKLNAQKILDYNLPDYVCKLEQIINKYL